MTICEDPSSTARQRGPDPLDVLSLEHDVDELDRDGVARVLGATRRIRSKLDAVEVRAHRRLRELESIGSSEPAEVAVATAADGDGRHGRSVSERDALCLDAPDVEDALDDGSLSGAHVDAMNAATRNLPPDVRSEFLAQTDALTDRAGRLSLDGFRRECRQLAKGLLAQFNQGNDADELERQRAASKVTQWTDRVTGMCSTLIEVDPIRNVEMGSAVRAEIMRLRQANGNSALTWKQLEAQAWVNCISGATTSIDAAGSTSSDSQRDTTGTPVRPTIVDRSPQIIAMADIAHLRNDAAAARVADVCETSDGIDLPAATLRRLCCDAEIIPVIMDGPSRVLDEGRSKRTATAEQRHALRTMHATCAFPGCSVGFESCRIHHVDWWTRDVGPTDLANLLPVCEHDHHRVHEGGWTVTLDDDHIATWTRPDGTQHHVGPTANRRPEP